MIFFFLDLIYLMEIFSQMDHVIPTNISEGVMFEWESIYFQLVSILDRNDLKGLFGLLRHHQEDFIKLLDVRPPKKEDRDKILKKIAIKPGEQYKRIAEKADEVYLISFGLSHKCRLLKLVTV
jgi:hypothetical protein